MTTRATWRRTMVASMIMGALAAGCGGAARMGESLVDTVTAYNQGVRWGRFPAAAAHVPAAERNAFLDDRDELAEDLRITDYELVGVEPSGSRSARVHVKYTWFRNSEDIVRETHADQRWEQQGKAWIIVDERRLRGPAMPGLLEPEPEFDDADATGRGADGAVEPAAAAEMD